MSHIRVAIINSSTVLTDKQVRPVARSLQTQISRDLGKAWGIDAELVVVPQGSKPPSGAWWLVLMDQAKSANHLGYHQMTDEGLPIGKVFAGTDLEQGHEWTVTASHELLEMLANPDVHLTSFVQPTAISITLFSREICDPCESDDYSYRINGIPVSDFVYPAWFESFQREDSAQFDHCKHIDKPFQILRGGYIDVFEVGSGKGWTMKLADSNHRPRPGHGSRKEHRRTPRDQWLKSKPKFAARAKSRSAATAR